MDVGGLAVDNLSIFSTLDLGQGISFVLDVIKGKEALRWRLTASVILCLLLIYSDHLEADSCFYVHVDHVCV